MSQLVHNFKVNSANVQYGNNEVIADYVYNRNEITMEGQVATVKPSAYKYTFKTNTKVPKMGLMLVGLGGNNGSTTMGMFILQSYSFGITIGLRVWNNNQSQI